MTTPAPQEPPPWPFPTTPPEPLTLAEALRYTREQHRDNLDALKALDFLEALL